MTWLPLHTCQAGNSRCEGFMAVSEELRGIELGSRQCRATMPRVQRLLEGAPALHTGRATCRA